MLETGFEGFRPYTHAECDREMDACFRREYKTRTEGRSLVAADERSAPVRGEPEQSIEATATDEGAGELNRLLAELGVDDAGAGAVFVDPSDSSPAATYSAQMPLGGEMAVDADVGPTETNPLRCELKSEFAPVTVTVTGVVTVVEGPATTTAMKEIEPEVIEIAGAPITGPVVTDETDPLTLPMAESSAFPVGDLVGLPEFDDPAREMTMLILELAKHNDYHRVRARYCRLSIRMNLVGQQAPGFRAKLSASTKRGDPVHMLMHRDRVVIDYHWCHTHMDLSANEVAHTAVFNSEEFDFGAAWRLTGKNWKSTYRAAEALCLTRLQQCQTMMLHDQELGELVGRLGAGWRASGGKTSSRLAQVNRALNEWAERDKRIEPQKRGYELLWLVREMLGPDGKSLWGRLHALAVGGPERDRTTIRDSVKRLDKKVGVI